MSHSLVFDGCDQQRCEEDISHLPVEEVYSVVRLRHHSRMVSACGIVLHALRTNPRRRGQNETKDGKMTQKQELTVGSIRGKGAFKYRDKQVSCGPSDSTVDFTCQRVGQI